MTMNEAQVPKRGTSGTNDSKLSTLMQTMKAAAITQLAGTELTQSAHAKIVGTYSYLPRPVSYQQAHKGPPGQVCPQVKSDNHGVPLKRG